MSLERETLRLIRNLEGDSSRVSPELFTFLSDVLADSDDAGADGSATATATTATSAPLRIDFFRVFIEALQWCPPEARVEHLRRLNYQAKTAGLRTETELSRRGGVLRVIGMLSQPGNTTARAMVDEILRMLHTLLSFSASVHEVKQIFRLMMGDDDPTRTKERPPYWSHLLGVLRSVTPRDGPNSFFTLSGLESGLQLPGFKLPGNGYTLVMWVRFETLVDRAGSGPDRNFSPTLAQFLFDDRSGLSVAVQ
jgi:hypothetical protein